MGNKPGQMAVTGFDDLPFASFLHPALTTVRQPLELVCNVLLNLLGLFKNRNEIQTSKASTQQVWLGPKQVLLHPELVIRASA